jgi:hypothetical protein
MWCPNCKTDRAHRSTEREIRANRRARAWKRKKRHLTVYGLSLVVFLIMLYSITRIRGGEDGGNSSVTPSSIHAVG